MFSEKNSAGQLFGASILNEMIPIRVIKEINFKQFFFKMFQKIYEFLIFWSFLFSQITLVFFLNQTAFN